MSVKILMQDRTIVVIAARRSTVIDADLIYVIDAGRVAESGTRAELISRDGVYARLYAMQFADQSVAAEARA
jgi:ATP-binding cassette, subfamily B, bacterial MsbA